MVVIKAEIRDQIVNEASRIFTRYGFKKTTMDEIALAMRKGKSSIYYYFTSKEEIFEAVVEKEASILRVELTKVIESNTTPQEKLKNYILARMKGFRKLSNIYEALKSDLLSHLDFINQLRDKYDKKEISMVEEILTKGVEEGVFQIENCHFAAIAIFTVMKGLEIPLVWTNKKSEFDRQLDNLLNVLFYGIMKQ
jgi:AcrR family transcriptional regulator